MNVQESAAKAAAEIRRRGWCQGRYEDAVGRVCAYGAMNVATFGGPGYGGDDACALAEAVRAKLGLVAVGHWNDAPERTEADVLAVFDAIAAGDLATSA